MRRQITFKDSEQLIALKRAEIRKLKDPECYYDFTSHVHDRAIMNMLTQQERRKGIKCLGRPHPTEKFVLDGVTVSIDRDILPVVKWMNGLHGVKTEYCCQGEVNDPEQIENIHRPYIVWRSISMYSVEQILRRFNDFHKHSSDDNIYHVYHEVQTEVEFFENDIRYCSRWFDHMALMDFIKWAMLGENNA